MGHVDKIQHDTIKTWHHQILKNILKKNWNDESIHLKLVETDQQNKPLQIET